MKQYGGDVPDTGTGLHEWLEAGHAAGGPMRAAAFDTRGSDHPLLSTMDHAPRTEEKLLGKLGTKLVAPAEHFFVAGPEGPLVVGEKHRARAWGRTLAQTVPAHTLSTWSSSGRHDRNGERR